MNECYVQFFSGVTTAISVSFVTTTVVKRLGILIISLNAMDYNVIFGKMTSVT